MRKEIKTLLMFLIVGLAATVFGSEKIYDPMDVFKRDVPPNILISVDNSGSMARDVNGTYLYDMRQRVNIDYNYSRATIGDFWHCNYPDVSNTRDPIPDQWDNYVENLSSQLGYSYAYASIPVLETGEVEYVSLAVDVWKPSTFVMDNADVELTLSHDGVSKAIAPTAQWYRIKKSTGSSYYYDTQIIGGITYRRYRMAYVFKDFYEMEKAGSWQLAIRDGGANGLILDSAYLHFNPLLSKMTILKVVLQRLIANTRSARLAMGMYGSRWTQNYRGVTDGNGIISGTNQYVWIMNTSDGGFKPLVGWPADPIDTQSNHEELLDWVNFDAVNSEDFDSGGTLGSPAYTREMMARGSTPIGLCLRDIATYVASNSTSSLDPSSECRNYSVIFMTDGYCTSGDCSDAYVHTQLQNIYDSHTAEDAAGNLQGVKTYIIGFALGNSSTLDGYAEAGHTDADGDPSNGAQAYAPNNSKELLEAFENAIAHASTQTFTGETQVMPIKLDPDLQNKVDENGEPYLVWQEQADDAILQSYFTYSARAGFTGHFKAYGILKPDGTLLGNNQYRPIWDVSDWEEITRDATGEPLVTEPIPRKGTISRRIEVIRSYLTPDVTEDNNIGGANTPVPFRESFRCIVTPVSTADGASLLYLNKYAYDRKVDRYVPDRNSVDHVMGTMGITTETEAVAFLDFLQTKTVGDTTYSTPAVIGAADSHYPDDSYTVFEAGLRDRQKVVYVGSNDGMLHCLDAHTGDELWAFIPADLFPRLSKMWEEYKLSGDLSGQPDPTGTTL
ncbi:MAG: PQQ-binding-like beta-propeller repeat protein, partial [Holophagae bacterium]|nr:PQQ-binding-like beta-propeller repeat protein [Holophagae bacterium]